MSSSGSSKDVYVETLAVFDQRDDPSEPLTTPEVADSLNAARRTVYKRLKKLVDRGDLKTKKAGANARVWWRSINGSSNSTQPSDSNQSNELEPASEVVLKRIADGIYGLDKQFRFTYLNARAEDLLDLEESAVLGQDIHEELSLTDQFETALHEAYNSQKPVFVEEYYDPLDAWFENAIYPLETGLSVYIREISERKRLEDDLRTEKGHFRTAVENSPLVGFRLNTDLRYTWIINPHEDFDPESVIGKREDELLPPEAAETVMDPKRKALETGERVREEVTYELPSGLVLYDLTVEPLRDETGEIVGLACVTWDITERKRREDELEVLTRLYRVFQEITDGIIESSSQEEIEQLATEQFMNSDLYEHVWCGRLDRHGEKIVPQSSGTEKIDLCEIPFSAATDDSTTYVPMAEAIRTGDIQVTDDSASDPVLDKWTQPSEIRHRTGISIPIAYEERTYGVLNVYTARENAFCENERRIIGRLGEVVGHAINAIERKRALLENRVQEITFRSQRLAEVFTGAISDESFTISNKRFVPLPDGQTIAYYSLDGLDPAVFIDVIEDLNSKTECRVIDEVGSQARVEVQQSEPTLASELAKYNSWIAEEVLRDGEFRIAVQVPQYSNVREVIDIVQDTYPDAKVVAQTEVERENPRLSDVVSDVDDQLTERQRTTLKVAYYSGYFDWPRAITGEELAERLDVSQGTVSHHLRHGERKLLSAFFAVAT
jgi:HTH-type transcriptional regulator, bacterioopsin transcriptional activator and related proteins